MPCYLPLLKVIQDIIEEIARICAMMQHSWVLEPTCQMDIIGFFYIFWCIAMGIRNYNHGQGRPRWNAPSTSKWVTQFQVVVKGKVMVVAIGFQQMGTNGLGVVKRGHECWWCVSLLTKNSQAHVRRDTHYDSNGWTNWELWYGLKLELLGVEMGLCENKVHIRIVHVSVDSHIYDMQILCECKSFTLTWE
jgi:hypothetical protein